MKNWQVWILCVIIAAGSIYLLSSDDPDWNEVGAQSDGD